MYIWHFFVHLRFSQFNSLFLIEIKSIGMTKMIKYLIYFSFFISISYAQNRSDFPRNFGHIDYTLGLSHNHVQCFAQDNDGFLWMGTISGLNRFDGYNFKIFKHDPADSTSSPNNNIRSIVKDQLGRLWIGTSEGMSIFNPNNEEFTNHFSLVSGGHSYYQYNLDLVIPYGDSILFFSIPGAGVLEHNILTNRNRLLQSIKNDTNSLFSIDISHLTMNGDDLYVTYNNGTIDVYNVKSNMVTRRISSLYRHFNGVNKQYETFVDHQKQLWVFIKDEALGLYQIDSTDKISNMNTDSNPALNSNIISSIIEGSDHQLWIGTDHGGINIFDAQSQQIEYIVHEPYNENSLSQNVITTFFKDCDNIIWIGTFKQGVNYYHENIFQFKHIVNSPNNIHSLPYNDVNCFAEDIDGNLWIGTNGDGLIYFDREKNHFSTIKANPDQKNTLQSNVIVSLYLDKGNHLWIGTYHGGLSYYDGHTFTNYLHNTENKESINDNKVWDIFEDSHGNLWIGLLGGGLDLFDREKGVFYHYSGNGLNALNSDFVMDITEDNDGNIWFGTDAGVFTLDFETSRIINFLHNSKNSNSLSDNFVYKVFQDSRGNIWAGTRNGLNLFSKKDNSFIPINNSQNTLSAQSIMSILESDEGDLWLATSNGLTKMMISLDEEENYKDHFSIVFNESDGLQGREFNEGSAIKTKHGELIFGGANGFNLYKPERNLITKREIKPHIIGLEIFGNHVGINDRINGEKIIHSTILDDSKIELDYSESMFSIKFVQPDFLGAKKIRYRYKLKGFHEQWIYSPWYDRKATFTNLNPGNYDFVVQTSDLISDWNDSETTVKIIISPPWYRARLAYFIYLIILMGLFIVLRNYLAMRLRNRILKEKAIEESERLHELNTLKSRFFTNVSHEFRTPLTLILTPLDNLLRNDLDPNTKKHLLIIRQNAARLLTLVNQLLDFRKVEKSKLKLNPSYGNIVNLLRQSVDNFHNLTEYKKIDLKFLANNEELFMQFDVDKTQKTINNLISNAIKFTNEGGTIHVKTELLTEDSNEFFIIKVEDDGLGIDKQNYEKVFERFYQVNLPNEFVSTGSGIGLSMAKEFVELHRGLIWVESELGKGSTFFVKLPVDRERIIEEEGIKEEMGQKIKLVEQLDEVVPQSSIKTNKNSILIVEDNSEFREYLKDSLNNLYNIMEAENGVQALELLDNNNADLIISDIMMPKMDGIQLCNKIKTDNRYSHIPVILLTAKSTHDDKVEGFSQGADEYITKPFDLDILESRIAYLINLRQKFIRKYQKSLSIQSNKESITSIDETLLKKTVSLINENISNSEFSVERLSKELGMSRVHLYKKTLSLTGKTPIELIRLVRLKKAAELILTSELTISEITYDVGFNDPRYFSKLFKNEFKVLPSKYKENNTLNSE